MQYASPEDVRDAFAFHPPKDETVSAMHSEARAEALQFAHWILENLPPCDERDTAIEKVREAMFWTNAGIACNQKNRGL